MIFRAMRRHQGVQMNSHAGSSGKHGGRKGMPKPEPKRPHGPDQGIVRDEKGQEQPRDKARAQQVHRTDTVGR